MKECFKCGKKIFVICLTELELCCKECLKKELKKSVEAKPMASRISPKKNKE